MVPSLKMMGKGIMRAYLFYDSEKDRANFIMQYKNGSDEGMRAWAELYESDERTRKLSRIVFSILFIPVIFFAILVVYFTIKINKKYEVKRDDRES